MEGGGSSGRLRVCFMQALPRSFHRKQTHQHNPLTSMFLNQFNPTSTPVRYFLSASFDRLDESEEELAVPLPQNRLSAAELLGLLASRRKFNPPYKMFPHPKADSDVPPAKEQDEKSTLIVDVRSPCEYNHAHVPGSINIPLFTDEQRKEVGITYKRAGKHEAVLRGVQLAGPNFVTMLRQVDKLFGTMNMNTGTSRAQRELLVYCARGGLRSRCMAFLFSLPDSSLSVRTVEGGYKAFRNCVLNTLGETRDLVVLGGLTGSGKTKVLHALAAMGEQVIDLEGWCHHKGSAFGGLGESPSGSPEMIENGLAIEWNAVDPSRPVWVEDESRHIGGVFLPLGVWNQMRSTQVIRIRVPHKQRVEHLVETYCKYDKEELKACLMKLTKRLGTERTKKGLERIDQGDLLPILEEVLAYYDRTYTGGLETRPSANIHDLELPSLNAETNARMVLDYYRQHIKPSF